MKERFFTFSLPPMQSEGPALDLTKERESAKLCACKQF